MKKIAESRTATGFEAFCFYRRADIVNTSDYGAWGDPLPQRGYSSSAYKYGFNGKEKLNELNGEGNGYDFGARIYNSILGRWLARDPQSSRYPDLSPFQFVANSPVIAVDPDGEKIYVVEKKGFLGIGRKLIEYQPGVGYKGTNQFVKETFAALEAQVNRGDEGDHICVLANDTKSKLLIKNTKKSSEYHGRLGKRGVVKWNPREGSIGIFYEKGERYSDVKIYPADQSTIFSPADQLDHDLGHAYDDLILGKRGTNARQDPSQLNLEDAPDKDEEEQILKHDNNNGKVRVNHDGLAYTADNIFDDKPTGEHVINAEITYKSEDGRILKEKVRDAEEKKKERKVTLEKGNVPYDLYKEKLKPKKAD